jgi:hypothetical protein
MTPLAYRSACYFSCAEHKKCLTIEEHFFAGAAMGRTRLIWLLFILVLVEVSLSLMENAEGKAQTTEAFATASGLASKQNSLFSHFRTFFFKTVLLSFLCQYLLKIYYCYSISRKI